VSWWCRCLFSGLVFRACVLSYPPSVCLLVGPVLALPVPVLIPFLCTGLSCLLPSSPVAFLLFCLRACEYLLSGSLAVSCPCCASWSVCLVPVLSLVVLLFLFLCPGVLVRFLGFLLLCLLLSVVPSPVLSCACWVRVLLSLYLLTAFPVTILCLRLACYRLVTGPVLSPGSCAS